MLRTNSNSNSNNIQEQQLLLQGILVQLVCLRINRIGLSNQTVVSNSNSVSSRISISLAINSTLNSATKITLRPLQLSRIPTQVVLIIFNLLAQSQNNQMTLKLKIKIIIMIIMQMLLLIQALLMMLLISESKELGSI